MGSIALLNQTGDTRITWTKGDADSVADARDDFERLIANGWQAFEIDVQDPEKRGRRVTAFDEELGEVVMVRPLKGG